MFTISVRAAYSLPLYPWTSIPCVNFTPLQHCFVPHTVRAVALSHIIDRLKSFPFFSSLHTQKTDSTVLSQSSRTHASAWCAVSGRFIATPSYVSCVSGRYVDDDVHLYICTSKYVCLCEVTIHAYTHSRAVRNTLPPSQFVWEIQQICLSNLYGKHMKRTWGKRISHYAQHMTGQLRICL